MIVKFQLFLLFRSFCRYEDLWYPKWTPMNRLQLLISFRILVEFQDFEIEPVFL